MYVYKKKQPYKNNSNNLKPLAFVQIYVHKTFAMNLHSVRVFLLNHGQKFQTHLKTLNSKIPLTQLIITICTTTGLRMSQLLYFTCEFSECQKYPNNYVMLILELDFKTMSLYRHCFIFVAVEIFSCGHCPFFHANLNFIYYF